MSRFLIVALLSIGMLVLVACGGAGKPIDFPSGVGGDHSSTGDGSGSATDDGGGDGGDDGGEDESGDDDNQAAATFVAPSPLADAAEGSRHPTDLPTSGRLIHRYSYEEFAEGSDEAIFAYESVDVYRYARNTVAGVPAIQETLTEYLYDPSSEDYVENLSADFFYAIDADGALFQYQEQPFYNPSSWFFFLPADSTPATTWTMRVDDTDYSLDLRWTIESDDATCTGEDISYDGCIAVLLTGSIDERLNDGGVELRYATTVTERLWYKPGLGLVGYQSDSDLVIEEFDGGSLIASNAYTSRTRSLPMAELPEGLVLDTDFNYDQ